MTDIVERLRSADVLIVKSATDLRSVVAEEAAAEIEKLRAALRQIGKGDICVALLSHPPICSRAFAARAALGEKE